MMELLSFTMNGLVLGLIFAVVAMGFTLILGVMQVINFTHGILFALGMIRVLAFELVLFLIFWKRLARKLFFNDPEQLVFESKFQAVGLFSFHLQNGLQIFNDMRSRIITNRQQNPRPVGGAARTE